MDYCKIGQQIRKFRKMRGLSQEELAEIINISTTHMSHIETGNTKLSLPVLVDLANALGVSTDTLLEGHCHSIDDQVPDEINRILSQCTSGQRKAMADILKATKQAIDLYL